MSPSQENTVSPSVPLLFCVRFSHAALSVEKVRCVFKVDGKSNRPQQLNSEKLRAEFTSFNVLTCMFRL